MLCLFQGGRPGRETQILRTTDPNTKTLQHKASPLLFQGGRPGREILILRTADPNAKTLQHKARNPLCFVSGRPEPATRFYEERPLNEYGLKD